MKIAVSGTYSSGKTRTVMALSHYTGIPRTLALAIREILPQAVPGKRLAEVTPAEFLQLMVQRHAGRVAHEAVLSDGFISDGSSLQEWLYGAVRVRYGMNPNETPDESIPKPSPAEMEFFARVVDRFGVAFKQHVKSTFDRYVHLKHELPIRDDGHRPMNEQFRTTIDQLLLTTLDELRIPYDVVQGSIEERLVTMVELLDLPTVMTVERAVELANADYARLDMRLETQRLDNQRPHVLA